MPDKIKNVIYLLLENQSFDRILGCFREIYSDLDGLNAPGQPAYVNQDDKGVVYRQRPTEAKQVSPDPKHEARFVLDQLKNNNGGFVLDFAHNYPRSTTEQRQEIMGYYPLDFLPALHTLARHFTICDHWFSSLPGPTWPNRFFALTGTSHGQALMPEGWEDPQLETYFDQTQDTIFDRLNEGHRSWQVYYYDFPSSLLLDHQRRPENIVRYHHIDTFFQACADGSELPDFVFLEPKYFGQDQNDDHPPHNIFKGEKLVADVYNAIRSNPKLWQQVLLVVTFDEHGGFYDHVSPRDAISPDDIPAKIDPKNPSIKFNFDRLGVRVPAVLVSPWVERRVVHKQFDHTSLLKYMIDKWDLGPLGKRTAAANSISVALGGHMRDDTPAFIRVPYTQLVPPDPALEREDSSDHHRALQAFAYILAKNVGDSSVLQRTRKEPGTWTRIKSIVGKLMLSVGARLDSDLENLNRDKIDAALETVESTIESVRKSGFGQVR